MSQNNFLLPVDDYQRELNPIRDYIHQVAWYASKQLNLPYEQCVEHLKKKIKNKEIPLHNPEVVFFNRGENGDTHQTKATLTQYLKNVSTQNLILAPTFTTYQNTTVQVSPIVGYLDENVQLRKTYKKLSQKYEAEKNIPMFKYYHNAQDNAKRANNSVSGGFVANGSIINNRTGHSTLTSITRSIASLSNASNERVIEGNRHYFTPQITLNNIVSIASNSDLSFIQAAIEKFGLKYPTFDETVACIWRSYSLYCFDTKKFNEIKAFVERMTPVERAAVVYTGDLYHIRIINEEFMRTLITRISRDHLALCQPSELSLVQATLQPDNVFDPKDPVKYIVNCDEQIVNYAHQINLTMMEGKGKKYEKLSYEEQLKLAYTCINIAMVVEYYKDFFKAFFLTKNSPATIATIPSQIRRSVVLSDTDSTMFSVDSWVKWYFDDYRFTDEGYAVAGSIMYIATQSIAHILALFSANMGVEKKRMFTLAMKPEFVFPVFAQTSVAKHYYTARKVKEGNVYADIEMEKKGVHMVDSTVPEHIIEEASRMMELVIRTVMDTKKISLSEMLKKTADIEREIINSIRKGETKYLRKTKIKEKKSYKLSDADGVDKTPYQFYTCWEKCFKDKYGDYGKPPYMAVRVPLDLPNPSSVKLWLDNLEDQTFANNFRTWLIEGNKKTIGQFPVPMTYCQSYGIPDVFIPVIDDKKIALTLTRSFRNILESLGFFPKKNVLICELGY